MHSMCSELQITCLRWDPLGHVAGSALKEDSGVAASIGGLQ